MCQITFNFLAITEGNTHRENRKETLKRKFILAILKQTNIYKKAPTSQEISNFDFEKKIHFVMLLSIIETSWSLLSSYRNILSLTKTVLFQYLSLKSIKYKIKE